MKFRAVQLALRNILEGEKDCQKALLLISKTLKKHISVYDWVGFYFMNDQTKNLHLGPYAGEETEHKVIPYGKGICGQVANSGQSFLVDDVNQQENYIACNLATQSELVVPLYLNKKLIAQIDIDSNTKKAFTAEDEVFLKDLMQLIAIQYDASLLKLQKKVCG
jgi:GAF domain-containing protein